MVCSRIFSNVSYYEERWMEELLVIEEESFVTVSQVGAKNTGKHWSDLHREDYHFKHYSIWI